MPKKKEEIPVVTHPELDERLKKELEDVNSHHTSALAAAMEQVGQRFTALEKSVNQRMDKLVADAKDESVKRDDELGVKITEEAQRQDENLAATKEVLEKADQAINERCDVIENALREAQEYNEVEREKMRVSLREQAEFFAEELRVFHVDVDERFVKEREVTEAWQVEHDRIFEAYKPTIVTKFEEIEVVELERFRVRDVVELEKFAAVHAEFQRLDRDTFKTLEMLYERIERCHREIQDQFQQLKEVVGVDLTRATLDFEVRTNAMKAHCEEYIETTKCYVHSWHNRNCHWQIRQFREKIRQRIVREGMSVLSPEFCFCEQWMQMEVLVQGAVPPEQRAAGDVSAPLPGGISVRVWCPIGIRLVFLLKVGKGANTTVSSRLENTFQAPAGTVLDADETPTLRAGFLSQNICKLDQAWVRKDNSVDVELEILEMHFLDRSVNQLAVRPPQALPTYDDECLRFVNSKETQCEIIKPGPTAADVEAKKAEEAEELERVLELEETMEEGEKRKAQRRRRKQQRLLEEEAAVADEKERLRVIARELEDDIERTSIDAYGRSLNLPSEPDRVHFERHIGGIATLRDKFTTDLLTLRNRAIRKIEWKLESVARILAHTKPGDSVESPPFSAAGVDELKILLFPMGRDKGNTPGTTQQCAVYINMPAKVSIDGFIAVGSIRRHFNHQGGEATSLGGCPSLGVLERQIDCEDCVAISVELTQVDIDLPEQGGLLCLRGTKPAASPAPPGRLDSPSVNSDDIPSPQAVNAYPPEEKVAKPLAQGAIRMRRGDPQNQEEMYRASSSPQLNQREEMKGKQQRQRQLPRIHA